jgi:hypothetical protein
MPAGGCVNDWEPLRIGVGSEFVAAIALAGDAGPYVVLMLSARSPKGLSSEVSAPLTTAQVRIHSATRIRTIASAAMTLTRGERGVDSGVGVGVGVGAGTDGPGSPAG